VKRRKSTTLEEKLDVIKKYGRNECAAGIANAMGIPETTLKTARKQGGKRKEICRSATRTTASKVAQIRAPIMEKLERKLAERVEH
jgi:hypothetical protein